MPGVCKLHMLFVAIDPLLTCDVHLCFIAEMHAILTNPALADVVGWAPHGRSWRIIKPREFEVRVLPKYVSFLK